MRGALIGDPMKHENRKTVSDRAVRSAVAQYRDGPLGEASDEIARPPTALDNVEPLVADTVLFETPAASMSSDESATILVVDDEALVRQVLTQHLGPAGYSLECAKNGPQALELLESGTIDLVLLDIMMPKMSGFEVCRAVRETKSRDELPIIFLSAKDRQEDRVASFDEGGNDYLTKPIGKRELLARVNVHLELQAVHRSQSEEIHELRGILPICSYCKKIREDSGYWSQLEVYISHHSEAKFSHGICPHCMDENFPSLVELARGAQAPRATRGSAARTS